MKRWFRSDSAPDPEPAATLPERLELLEREAEQATLGFQGMPLNRAGDECMQAGSRAPSLTTGARSTHICKKGIPIWLGAWHGS